MLAVPFTQQRRFEAIPQPDALAEIERCAGTQFDPTVVKALAEELRVPREPDAALAS